MKLSMHEKLPPEHAELPNEERQPAGVSVIIIKSCTCQAEEANMQHDRLSCDANCKSALTLARASLPLYWQEGNGKAESE